MRKILATLIITITYSLIQSCQSQPSDGIKEYKYLNGNTQFIYTYKEGKLNGDYKAFYESGKLWAEGNYINGELNGSFKTYTQDGSLAKEEDYKNGTLVYQKIYWQPIPEDNSTFLFVSKKGYTTISNGKYIPLNDSTPDNIIQDKLNIKTGEVEYYITKKGEMVIYKPISK